MQETKKKVPQNIESQSLIGLFTSSVARKAIVAATGMLLLGFIMIHLLGNFSLFLGADAFNGYAHKLESLGPFLYVMELGLLLVFVLHVVGTIQITRENRRTRQKRYLVQADAGAPSKMTISSRSMIYTGLVLLVFLISHILTFKYGPYYETVHDGIHMRDLYRLMVEVFQNEWYVGGYVAAMVFLGFHLRHGFWSFFQSLGAYHKRYTPIIYALGIAFAILMATGYIVLPIWIYFKH